MNEQERIKMAVEDQQVRQQCEVVYAELKELRAQLNYRYGRLLSRTVDDLMEILEGHRMGAPYPGRMDVRKSA